MIRVEISEGNFEFYVFLNHSSVEWSFGWLQERIKMRLARALYQFTKWFHFLGQSCYSSFDAFPPATNANRNSHSPNLIPSVALLTLIVTATITTWSTIFLYAPPKFVHSVVIIICVSSMTFTILIAMSQSISRREQFAELIQQINMMETLTRTRFTINFRAFRRYYLRQIIIIFVSCIFAFVGTLTLRPIEPGELTITLTVVALRFVTLITVFHLLFYICLFHYIARAFVEYVEKQANSFEHSATTTFLPPQWGALDARNLIIELDYFKLIHFVLWEISDLINKVFGWTIAAVILHLSLYFIYNVYFALVLLFAPKFESESMRKLKLKCLFESFYLTRCA